MKDADKRAGELSDLAHRIDRFERAHTPVQHSKPLSHRPIQPPISDAERKARRWFFGVVAAWGGLMYAGVLVQGWGRTSLWEKIIPGFFVALCVFAIYGIHLFYVELAKSAVRTLRGKKTTE